MTDNIVEGMPNEDKRGKKSFTYVKASTTRKTTGSSSKDLGDLWGVEPGRITTEGRATRARTLPIPGSLEPAQEEHGVPKEGSGLDHVGEPSDQPQGHDQDPPVIKGSDQSVRSPDQPERMGDGWHGDTGQEGRCPSESTEGDNPDGKSESRLPGSRAGSEREEETEKGSFMSGVQPGTHWPLEV